MEHGQPGASGLKVPAPSFGTGTFADRTDPTATPPGLGPAAHHGRDPSTCHDAQPGRRRQRRGRRQPAVDTT
ncbi:hypothetical protein ACIBLB_05835 [Streptosporangium canum]|uniref:hypothetical protein n=1 Tax=Streptosporangium canum TaxID=324952 RepID=UPI0037A51797